MEYSRSTLFLVMLLECLQCGSQAVSLIRSTTKSPPTRYAIVTYWRPVGNVEGWERQTCYQMVDYLILDFRLPCSSNGMDQIGVFSFYVGVWGPSPIF